MFEESLLRYARQHDGWPAGVKKCGEQCNWDFMVLLLSIKIFERG
jgi:hypothetical protein